MVRTLVALVALVILVAVPPAIAGQAAKSSPSSAKAAVTGAINLNAATAADLQRLPGIGAKTADRIIEYRQKNGGFKKIEELMNIRGVGEKNFLKLRMQVTVSAPKAEPKSPQP